MSLENKLEIYEFATNLYLLMQSENDFLISKFSYENLRSVSFCATILNQHDDVRPASSDEFKSLYTEEWVKQAETTIQNDYQWIKKQLNGIKPDDAQIYAYMEGGEIVIKVYPFAISLAAIYSLFDEIYIFDSSAGGTAGKIVKNEIDIKPEEFSIPSTTMPKLFFLEQFLDFLNRFFDVYEGCLVIENTPLNLWLYASYLENEYVGDIREETYKKLSELSKSKYAYLTIRNTPSGPRYHGIASLQDLEFIKRLMNNVNFCFPMNITESKQMHQHIRES